MPAFAPARYMGGPERSAPSVDKLVSNMESSFEGHTVDALVLTGDEGRDKLR